MSALLDVQSLTAGHGRVPAVRELDLEVQEGEVLALLGPNGAGKTTLLLTLAGLLPRLGGAVHADGRELPTGDPGAARRAGIVLVPDDRALFPTLTTEENMKVARSGGREAIDEVLEHFPRLRERWGVRAGMLSGGEQQMLAMARALVQRPRVLLIDEMSMGLAPVVVAELLPVVRRVADASHTAVVLVEQHVGLALEVADTAVALVHGEAVVRGEAAALRANPARLEAAYLGEAVAR
jgi:branched-chain amino acid transport system ATP-binding protein